MGTGACCPGLRMHNPPPHPTPARSCPGLSSFITRTGGLTSASASEQTSPWSLAGTQTQLARARPIPHPRAAAGGPSGWDQWRDADDRAGMGEWGSLRPGCSGGTGTTGRKWVGPGTASMPRCRHTVGRHLLGAAWVCGLQALRPSRQHLWALVVRALAELRAAGRADCSHLKAGRQAWGSWPCPLTVGQRARGCQGAKAGPKADHWLPTHCSFPRPTPSQSPEYGWPTSAPGWVMAGLVTDCSPLPSLAASVQLWRSRLGRVMCSMANCLLLMKVRVSWAGVGQGVQGSGTLGPRPRACHPRKGSSVESSHCQVQPLRPGSR